MKCIDAIEGTVKSILQQLHGLCIDQNLDDTEYVRNVKAVIDATRSYLTNNPEAVENPQLLTEVLYTFGRSLWLSARQPNTGDEFTKNDSSLTEESQEYQTYFYDYLYHRGIYPR